MEKDGEPWFVGKDAAAALGYTDTAKAIRAHVDAEDKQIIKVDEMATLDVKSNFGMTIINESGLYSLIFGSKLEKAKAFKHWVTSEVLPCIRKHGGYISSTKMIVEILNILAANS
nr:BRO family protein [Ruminococcus sp. AF17-12]